MRVTLTSSPSVDVPRPSIDAGEGRVAALATDRPDIGPSELTIEPGTSFYREPSGEAAWQTFSTGYGPAKTLAGKLDDKTRGRLRDEFIAFHDDFATELGICVPRDSLVIRGTRK